MVSVQWLRRVDETKNQIGKRGKVETNSAEIGETIGLRRGNG